MNNSSQCTCLWSLRGLSALVRSIVSATFVHVVRECWFLREPRGLSKIHGRFYFHNRWPFKTQTRTYHVGIYVYNGLLSVNRKKFSLSAVVNSGGLPRRPLRSERNSRYVKMEREKNMPRRIRNHVVIRRNNNVALLAIHTLYYNYYYRRRRRDVSRTEVKRTKKKTIKCARSVTPGCYYLTTRCTRNLRAAYTPHVTRNQYSNETCNIVGKT